MNMISRPTQLFEYSHTECDRFSGAIVSGVERTNDVIALLETLGVDYLVPDVLVDEKLKALLYKADLGQGKIILVVELYYAWAPKSVEWRRRDAKFTLQLDADLIVGLEDGVAITESVAPSRTTAIQEMLLDYSL